MSTTTQPSDHHHQAEPVAERIPYLSQTLLCVWCSKSGCLILERWCSLCWRKDCQQCQCRMIVWYRCQNAACRQRLSVDGEPLF